MRPVSSAMREDPRADIVTHGRRWLGTPFVHCGRSATGLDCLGHMLAVSSAMGYRLHDCPKRPYSTVVTPLFGRYLKRAMVEIPAEELLPGDWAFIGYDTPYGTHVAMVTESQTIVHACNQARKVIEITYSGAPRLHTLNGFRFREIA